MKKQITFFNSQIERAAQMPSGYISARNPLFLAFCNIMAKEIWKDIAGYEGLYQVSSIGRVKSLERKALNKNGNVQTFYSTTLKPYIRDNGRITINLSKDGKIKVTRLHRIIATAFIPNIENLPEIDHLDGNPSNNSIENLRWVTHEENMNNPIHKIRRGTANKTRDYSKIKKNGTHVFQKDISTGKIINTFISVSEASNITKTDRKSIYNCCNNKIKQANGYHWEFKH